MSLVPQSITALAETDLIGSGKNIVAGASVSITKSGGGMATIYSDAAGTTTITLPTVTDSSGELLFYIESGSYIYTIAGSPYPVFVSDKNQVVTVETFAALATTPATTAGMVVYLKQHTSGGVGGGHFQDAAGTITNDGGTLINNTVTAGRHWKRTGYEQVSARFWNNNLALALVNCPDGAIYLDYAVYEPIGFTLVRNNLTIIGKGKPWYNVGKTGLWGGTIIKGPFSHTGDNFHVEKCGFDAGLDVCNALYGGTAQDAFRSLDPTRAIRTNVTVKNCVALCKDPASAAHNFLLEGLAESRFEDLHSRFGQWGTVMKTQNSTADGIYSFACSQAGYTFKSDTGVAGSPALSSSVTNLIIDNTDYPTAAQGILIYAASSSLAWFTLSNFQINKGDLGLTLLCDTRAVNVNLIKEITINNGVIRDCTTNGIKSFGAISNSKLSDIEVVGTTSNQAIKVWSDCLGLDFVNVSASSPVTDPLNIDIAGRFTLTNVLSYVGGDYTSPSGLNLAPENNNTFKVNGYIGKLTFNGGAYPWVPAFTGLTVVNGTGGATYSGDFYIVGNYIMGTVLVAVTGTATTASTASITRINNLPLSLSSSKYGSCSVTSTVVETHGNGLVQAGGANCFTPTWAAANTSKVISFKYPIN